MSTQHFWLSTTPSVPGSISWDAGLTRMATLARLRLRSPPRNGQKDVFVLNTHFDDRGLVSRAKAAEVILQHVNALKQDGHLVVLVGDINSPAREQGYQRLTGGRYPTPGSAAVPPFDGITFLDTAKEMDRAVIGQAGLFRPYGEHNTFTGFQPSDKADVIDVVLVLDNGAIRTGKSGGKRWRVRKTGVLPNWFDDGEGGSMMSDHRMVVARLEWVG